MYRATHTPFGWSFHVKRVNSWKFDFISLHARERSDSTLEYNSILDDCEFLMFFDALWWKCSYLAHTCVHIWHRSMGGEGVMLGTREANFDFWFPIVKSDNGTAYTQWVRKHTAHKFNEYYVLWLTVDFILALNLAEPPSLDINNNIKRQRWQQHQCGRSWWEREETQAHQRGGGGEQAKR